VEADAGRERHLDEAAIKGNQVVAMICRNREMQGITGAYLHA